ncbi:MAG: DUF192 domain-containing protein [Gallionella sp.]
MRLPMAALDRSVDLRSLVILLVLLCISLSASAAPVVAGLRLGAHVIRAEIANTEKSRAQGLMHRKEICAYCGMLFVFPEAGKYGFWMKSTSIPLSVAFISSNGIITKIVDMQPGSEAIHEGPEDTLYALETRAGWFGLSGIGVGVEVRDMKTMAYFRSMAE